MTVKDIREAAGLTLQQCADRAGLTKQAVSLIEVGRVPNPLYDTMVRLAAALNTSTEALHLAIRKTVAARKESA